MRYVEVASALAALNVASVKRRFAHPPASLNAADLPALWVQLPQGESGPPIVFTGERWPVLRVDVVIAVIPVAQSTVEASFAATLEMMDALAEALAAARVGPAPLTWSIRQDVVAVAEAAYWAVVATVEVRG